ncbi:unnamed protein product [Toxocara canis]|uniref:SH3 domain-containing protein n=1 Tax=Toxocara canis TaxID=6265 RepID=A0A183V4L4_TOXCA|nr:unnamed protein product [Toxocara canis]
MEILTITPRVKPSTPSGADTSFRLEGAFSKNFPHPPFPKTFSGNCNAVGQCRSGISAQGSSSREGAAHCTQVEARHGTDVSHSRKTFALARAAEDWNGDPDKEQLPTKQGEILKIMERRRTTCKCLNSAGQSGWVPTQKLLRMAPRDHK